MEKSMKTKIISAVAAGSLLFSAGAAYSASTLMQIGRSPFHRPPLASTADLQEMLQSQAADVKRGFEKAGRPELYQPFMEQVGSVDIQLVDFPKGTYFEWMFFKRKGSGAVRVARDLTWGNEIPFPAYTAGIVVGDKKYNFAVPLGCGNVALLGSEDIVPEVIEEEVVVVNQPPVCSATVSPRATYWGEPVVVDASASSDPDGRVVGMELVAMDADGNPISKEVVRDSLIGSIALPQGATSIRASVIDDAGEMATSPSCVAAVAGMKRMNMVADVGAYHMIDPGTWVFGRVGLEYHFDEDWSVLGMVGFAPHVGGSDGDSAALVDVLGEYKINRFFVNLGLGGWISSGDNDLDAEDSGLDLIAGCGVRLFGEDDGFNTSLFTELRSSVDELGQIIDYGRFGAGLRFRF